MAATRVSYRSRAKLIATWVVAAAIGVAAALVAALILGPVVGEALVGEPWYGGPVVAFFVLWAGIPLFATFAQSREARFAASGVLVGFAGLSMLANAEGPVLCGGSGLQSCFATAETLWVGTNVAAFGAAILLLALAIRGDRQPHDKSMSPFQRAPRGSSPHRFSGLDSGPALISELERKLGMSVVVHSVDDSAPVRIHALLRYGPRSLEVTAIGPSEQDAWRELARMAAEWRNANENLVPLWGGGL